MARRCCAQRNTSEIFRGVSEWAAQLVECRFHLERPDEVARGLDHVVAAPDEPVVTVGVATGDIAGALPAVHERLLVALVLVEIRPEHRGPPARNANSPDRPGSSISPSPPIPQVVEVVGGLAGHDVKIAIVSDFHVDLRPHVASLGLRPHLGLRPLVRDRGRQTPPDDVPGGVGHGRRFTGALPESPTIQPPTPAPHLRPGNCDPDPSAATSTPAPTTRARALAGRCGTRGALTSATTQWFDDSTRGRVRLDRSE